MKKYTTLLLWTALMFSEEVSAQSLYTAPLGIEAYTYRNSFPVDIVKTLDTIQSLGFTEMEGGSYSMPPKEFKKLCDARGIHIISTGADYDELIKSPGAVAHKAKSLGAKYVMCAWIPHSNSGFTLGN